MMIVKGVTRAGFWPADGLGRNESIPFLISSGPISLKWNWVIILFMRYLLRSSLLLVSIADAHFAPIPTKKCLNFCVFLPYP